VTASAPKMHVPKKEERSLREIFNAALIEAHQQFPELRGKLAVYNLVDNRLHGGVDLAAAGLKDEKTLRSFLEKAKKTAEKANSSVALQEKELKLIVYEQRSLVSHLFTRADQPQDMRVLATFDHELGHLLVTDAMKYTTLSEQLYAESAADTYAVIRNIQRFGSKAIGTDVLSWQRAAAFIETGSQSHFTSFTLDAFAKVQGKIDFSALTPQQSLQLARRFALEHTPHESTMRGLAEAFAPYRAASKKTPEDREAALKLLAEITLGDAVKGYYTFRLGARMLSRYLNDGVSVNGTRIQLRGDDWDRIRRAMRQRELQIARDEILAGFPLKKPASPANNNRPGPTKYLKRPRSF